MKAHESVTLAGGLTVRKEFTRHECERMPGDWGRVAWRRYRGFVRRAVLEATPGFNTLMAGIVQGIQSKDRQVIDQAVEVVRGHLRVSDVVQMHGSALCAIDQYEEGIEKLRSAIDLAPSVGNLMALSQELGMEDLDEKVILCRRSLEADPNDVDAMSGLAFALISQGHLADAEPYVVRAIGLAPRDGRVAEIYAEFLFRSGHYKKALKFYRLAIRRQWAGRLDKRLWHRVAGCNYYLGRRWSARRAALRMKEACLREGMGPDDSRITEVFECLEADRRQDKARDGNPRNAPESGDSV